MKKIIILAIILLLNSCKNEEEFLFINKIINEPDSLELIITKSIYFFGINKESEHLFSHLNEAINLIKEFQFEYQKHGYSIQEDSIYINPDNSKENIPDTAHIIAIKGITGDKLKFVWFKFEGKWEFAGLGRDQFADYDKEKGNFIKNVLKYPDSLFYYLKQSNFTFANDFDSLNFNKEMNLDLGIIKKYKKEINFDSIKIYPGMFFETMKKNNNLIPGVIHIMEVEVTNGVIFDFLWKKDGDKWEFLNFGKNSID